MSTLSTDPVVAQLGESVKCLRGDKKRLLLLGAPGSGKGTHSEWMKADYNLCHISTGDALREVVNSGSKLGEEVKSIMAAGALVSDEIVLQIVREKLQAMDSSCGGFILDGFPRTLQQAQGLDKMLEETGMPINGVLYFECSEETLKRRICGRRIHKPSGRTYHIINKPPKVEGKDDVTGEDLIQRPDDNEESLKTRLRSFNESTRPLISYYEEKGVLFRFNCDYEAETVKPQILSLFKLANA